MTVNVVEPMHIFKWGGLFNLQKDDKGELHMKVEVMTKAGQFKPLAAVEPAEMKEIKVNLTDLPPPTPTLWATEEEWQELRMRKAAMVWTPGMLAVSAALDDKFGSAPAKIEDIVATTPRDQLATFEFWGGLLHWATGPARPTYRGQVDKALHFVFGGFIGFNNVAVVTVVARVKEALDRVLGIGQYDEADIDATIEGGLTSALFSVR